ncbi:MAG: tetratricopeptide repeat protein [candidate division WOR-3 bacterium]|jgi:Ca-activated chloride channel family protein
MIFILLIALDMSPLVNKANKMYQKEKYEEAYEIYKDASILYPDKEKIKFNLADCAYQLKRYREAGDEFARLTTSKNKEIKQKSFYNLGNVFMEAKQYDQAISSYKQALLLNPKDKRAKRNLEIAKMMKKQQQQNKDKEKEDKKQQEQQQKQQQQQQEQQQTKPSPQEKINKALENEQKETMKKALQRKGGKQEEAGKW